MKFVIITHTPHKIKDNNLYAYEPYIREMNLWLKNVSKVKIVAPVLNEEINEIETNYNFKNIVFSRIPSFNILTFLNKLKAIFKIPYIFFKIFIACYWADHIHVRCPGNIGLIGCFVQIFFPSKKKTIKYAGNWDPNSKQPFSYRLQKKIISNTFLTKNCKVLVYGEWENQSKNIIPFFTATYYKSEIENFTKKNFADQIECIFVGSFTKSKQPLLSIKAIENLIKKGHNIKLNMFGNGEEFDEAKKYVTSNKLSSSIFLHGNQTKEIVKKYFQKSHFLLFLSKSEGWPKVVAEAMFWECIPISKPVSCVPFMLDNGKRGSLVDDNIESITQEVEKYILKDKDFEQISNKARIWSQKFVLEHFSSEISKLFSHE